MQSFVKTLLLILLPISCGSTWVPPKLRDEVKVGPTTIKIYDDAIMYDDFLIVLDAMQHALAQQLNNTELAIRIFDIELSVISCTRRIPWYGRELAEDVVGVYNVYGNITIRACYETLWDTALFHEIFQHRAAHVLSGNPNANHSADWARFESIMRERTRAYLYNR